MHHQIEVDASAQADGPHEDGVHQILDDLAYKRVLMVNVVFVGERGAGNDGWVLVDAGLPGRATSIKHAAEQRFGINARPRGIVLTHGHFDHVGSLEALAEEWDVPIFAHALERPYLDGSSSYPPPDPKVGGGLMSLTSPLLPRGPIDVRTRLRTLPADGSVPVLPGWRWIHTPGHAPGHVSLWCEATSALIVGDAFITTAQESAYAVATQAIELHGPPMYFTPDWPSAKTSVQRLAALSPEVVISGHGRPLRGEEMRRGLRALARDFDRVAVPEHGKYVDGG